MLVHHLTSTVEALPRRSKSWPIFRAHFWDLDFVHLLADASMFRQSQAVAGSPRKSQAVAGGRRQSQAFADSPRQSQTVAGSRRKSQAVADTRRQSPPLCTVKALPGGAKSRPPWGEVFCESRRTV